MKQVTAVDAQGKTWTVYEGDSGWIPCQALLKAGVQEVVLPRATLLSGAVLPLEEFTPLTTSTDVIQQFPEVKAVVRRGLRLRDCVAYLERQEANV